MKRLIVGACATLFGAVFAVGPTPIAATDARTLPMQFEVRVEGPADACGDKCRTWVSAVGAITADTPRDFETFAKKHALRGKTLVLDSDGGSVHGALALGRALRKLGMNTSVGKSIDIAPAAGAEKRSRLVSNAYCESMCAFVLLAGAERHVPPEARVLVHQIWLGDRRDDPTAANYSAEDLVLVQRDIGRLAQYTVEMGGGIDLLEVALKIPPWEPMRALSREELRAMKLVTADDGPEVVAGPAKPVPTLASGARTVVNERTWLVLDKQDSPMLARRHPLTLEGDDIGVFELVLGCGETTKDYTVTYIEQRRATSDGRTPEVLTDVEMWVAGKPVTLKVVSSRSNSKPHEIDSVATGTVSADLIKTFADTRARSLTVETSSEDMATAIRIGNAGVSRTFSQFAASCGARIAAGGGGAPRTELRREAEAQPR
jgi:hypothetical protein